MNLPAFLSSCQMQSFVLDTTRFPELNSNIVSNNFGATDLSDSIYKMVMTDPSVLQPSKSNVFGHAEAEVAVDSSRKTGDARPQGPQGRTAAVAHTLIQGQSIFAGLLLQLPSGGGENAKDMFPKIFMSNLKNLMFHYRIDSPDGCVCRELGHHLILPADASREIFAIVSQHSDDSHVMIFSKLTLQVPSQYLKTPLSLALSLSMNASNYNVGCSGTQDVGVIRNLLDEYRFRPSKLPAREASVKIEYILPIATSYFSKELLYSNMAMCSVVIENDHPSLNLVIDSVNIQYDETKIASMSNKLNSRNGNNNNNSSSNSKSNSNISRGGDSEYLNPIFQFEYIKNPANETKFPCIIHPQEAFSLNFKIGTQTVNESTTTALSVCQYFGDFITPFSVLWKMSSINSMDNLNAKEENSEKSETIVNTASASYSLNANIPWSLGRDLLNKQLLHDEEKVAARERESSDPNTFCDCVSITDFHITCEAPPVVQYLQPFTVKLFLRNKGSTASIVMFRHTPELFTNKSETLCPFTVLEGIEQSTIFPNQEITKELTMIALNSSGTLCLNEVSLRDVGSGKSYFFSKHIQIAVGSI